MKMRFIRSLLGITAISLLTACASTSQLAVPLAPNALATPNKTVGVAMSVMPKVDTSFPGAGCLLCMAAASMTNSTLTTHTQTLTVEDLPKLKEQVADILRKKGSQVNLINDPLVVAELPRFYSQNPNSTLKDFTALKTKYRIDKLLLIDLQQVGITRDYANYVPAGDPKANVTGIAALINLETNTYEWYLPLNIMKSAENGKWDEPPKFPGLTNAYFQVLEITKDSILNPLNN